MNITKKTIVMSLYFACSACSMRFMLPAETLTPYQKRLSAAKIARLAKEAAEEQLKLLPAQERDIIHQKVEHVWHSDAYETEKEYWSLVKKSAGTRTVIVEKEFWLPELSLYDTYEWKLEEQNCWVLRKRYPYGVTNLCNVSFSHAHNTWYWARLGAHDEIVGDPKICPFQEDIVKPTPNCLSSCCRSLREKIGGAARDKSDKQS